MMEERTKLLEDALDHIMKVAGQAHRPTTRLDWISDRARLAVRGEKYSEDKMPQYPKNRSRQNEFAQLKSERDALLAALKDLIVIEPHYEVDKIAIEAAVKLIESIEGKV